MAPAPFLLSVRSSTLLHRIQVAFSDEWLLSQVAGVHQLIDADEFDGCDN